MLIDRGSLNPGACLPLEHELADASFQSATVFAIWQREYKWHKKV